MDVALIGFESSRTVYLGHKRNPAFLYTMLHPSFLRALLISFRELIAYIFPTGTWLCLV